ncbi:urease accessory protein UreF [Sphingobium indicum]|uniref:Urease accessory protein UreF n=2 Tax=Sphingobium indicum TaxID=332055 RepID=A0A1L5BPH1_SPHIB|nr:urease accessory protein UreF [Sphingobium indicum]APL94698.1 urease accessory protein [Sphingobium indicum B90A]NYI23159.1 urease accessory protein [Sphingobium indicum]RYM04443.1 urease accessory protein UreF [Sphingobium indicum]
MGAIIMTAGIITATSMRMDEGALFDLMSWMSPAWPIGAFAHSGGLEWAVEAGFVTDRASTADWIGDLIARGSAHNDMVLFVHAWRAARAGDRDGLLEIADLGAASQTSHERRLEATAQGGAFRRIALDATGASAFDRLIEGIEPDDLVYPVAAAALFACHGIALRPAATAYLHGLAANLVSAAQRLVPLGQTDGQRVMLALRPAIIAAAAQAADLPDGDPFLAMGSACLMADLGSMAHETQYTRLFRT